MRQTSCKWFGFFIALPALLTQALALAFVLTLLLAFASAPTSVLAETNKTRASTPAKIAVNIATKIAAAKSPVILILGDSLSSAFGMAQQQGWVNLLQNRLRDQKYPHHVVNASITGETTQGGASRINGLLTQHLPEIVLVELGANDGLRGLPISLMRNSLSSIVDIAKSGNAQVLLIGMQLPPNYGIRYTRQFIETYSDLSAQHSIVLVPFLMKGFATNREMIQADGIHPRPEAQPLMLDNVWPELIKLLGQRTKTK